MSLRSLHIEKGRGWTWLAAHIIYKAYLFPSLQKPQSPWYSSVIYFLNYAWRKKSLPCHKWIQFLNTYFTPALAHAICWSWWSEMCYCLFASCLFQWQRWNMRTCCCFSLYVCVLLLASVGNDRWSVTLVGSHKMAWALEFDTETC